MKGLLKERNRQKHLFRTIYCWECKQKKTCGTLTGWDKDWERYCCWCYYQSEQAKAEEYSSYEEVLVSKQIDRERRFRQLQLLQSYRGCQECRSKEVDAYSWCEKNRLICWACLVKKEGGASSPISFVGESKWYRKYWGINLSEWLENLLQLPVNKTCADKWLKDKEHLEKCDCLEVEARESYLLFSNSLRELREKLKDCQCEESEKVRVDYLDSEGSGWIYCEKCEAKIESVGHHGVIKNRNDPQFWGLEVKKRVLCGFCLGNLIEMMPRRKKYLFWEYGKRGYWKIN